MIVKPKEPAECAAGKISWLATSGEIHDASKFSAESAGEPNTGREQGKADKSERGESYAAKS